MGRLGSGVGGDGIGFEEFQVRGLGSGRSKELGSEEFGSRGRVGIKDVGELESGVKFGRLGLGGGYGGLGVG